MCIALVCSDFKRAQANEFSSDLASREGYEAMPHPDAESPPRSAEEASAEEEEPRTWIGLLWDTCVFVWPDDWMLQVGRGYVKKLGD